MTNPALGQFLNHISSEPISNPFELPMVVQPLNNREVSFEQFCQKDWTNIKVGLEISSILHQNSCTAPLDDNVTASLNPWEKE